MIKSYFILLPALHALIASFTGPTGNRKLSPSALAYVHSCGHEDIELSLVDACYIYSQKRIVRKKSKKHSILKICSSLFYIHQYIGSEAGAELLLAKLRPNMY